MTSHERETRRRGTTTGPAEPPEAVGDTESPEPAPETVETGGLPAEPAESAIQRLEEQLEEAKDKMLRLAADYDNYRKRVARERMELADRAQASLVVRLLDVLDDLDRLAVQDVSQLSADVLHEALLLVDRKLRKELETAGLTRVHPEGQPFDPSWHEAVATVPAPDSSLDHTVSSVFQSGYRFKDSLVRPARVEVYSTEGTA